MSSKAGRIKRTKNVRNLDSHDAPSLAQSIIDEQPNIIPAGRQLDRTPPSKMEGVTTSPPSKPDGSPTSEQVVKDVPCGQVNKQTTIPLLIVSVGHSCFSHTNTNVYGYIAFNTHVLFLYSFFIMRIFWPVQMC